MKMTDKNKNNIMYSKHNYIDVYEAFMSSIHSW